MADNSTFPDAWRADLRAQFIKLGAEPARADEIVDLAVHAQARALEALEIVIDSGSDAGIKTSALPLAVQLLAMRAEQIAEAMAEHLAKQGDVASATVEFSEVAA